VLQITERNNNIPTYTEKKMKDRNKKCGRQVKKEDDTGGEANKL
jgi:hypothetical protein